MNPLIDALVAKRQALELTQQQIADTIGVTRSAIGRFETRHDQSPLLVTIERYAAAVGMQLSATDTSGLHHPDIPRRTQEATA